MSKVVSYRIIAKVGSDKFVKYRSDNLLSFTKFLDRKFKDWRYFNVYDKQTEEQIGNFTKNNKPNSKQLNDDRR